MFQVEDNQNVLVGVAIGVVVVMVSICQNYVLYHLDPLCLVPQHALLLRSLHYGQIISGSSQQQNSSNIFSSKLSL